MTETPCPTPLDFADLVDYWTGDLSPADDERVEEHIFACEACGRALAIAESLGRGVADVVRQGRLHSVVTDGILNRLAADGVRIRMYTLEGSAVVPCAVWAGDDLVVARVRGDFSGLDSVTILTRKESGEEIGRQAGIAVRPGQREILNALSAARLRKLPATLVHVIVTGQMASGGERTVAEYTLDHAGAMDRVAGQ
jgi:hypothetical protein